jgi:hypothetical protein
MISFQFEKEGALRLAKRDEYGFGVWTRHQWPKNSGRNLAKNLLFFRGWP